MVQLKYFGDDRDFFKYDLITHIFENSNLKNYAFIPMLTEHRVDNEGNIPPKHNGDRSDKLFQFISHCPNKSLNHWEDWLKDYIQSYQTVGPADLTYFSDINRLGYWSKFKGMINSKNVLVFVDPDTGLETGSPSYLRKAGREKYILNTELNDLIEALSGSSVMMIYQHLQRNKTRHYLDVEKKIGQVKSINAFVFVSAYREDDLAFIFIAKTPETHNDIFCVLRQYHAKSTHKYRSVHGSLISNTENSAMPRVVDGVYDHSSNATERPVLRVITSSEKSDSPFYLSSSEAKPILSAIKDQAALKMTPAGKRKGGEDKDKKKGGENVRAGYSEKYKARMEQFDERRKRENMERLKKELDYADLRLGMEFILKERFKDTKATREMVINKYTSSDTILAEDMRKRGKVIRAITKEWIKDITDEELLEIIRRNAVISPEATLQSMRRFISTRNWELLNKYMMDGCGRKLTSEWPYLGSLVLTAIIVLYLRGHELIGFWWVVAILCASIIPISLHRAKVSATGFAAVYHYEGNIYPAFYMWPME